MKENSEVLARKYRPKRFEDLIGQETIAQTLSLALDSNRLSHAYLLSGLRGSGKTSTARIFSKALVCDNGPTSKPCDVCEQCVMSNEGRHMDIIEMDAASSRKIDDIRDLIEHTKYKPAVAKFKVFIIDEVHMLTKEAFNALLKTLEEPPAYVKFILATTDPLKLPATILSRTQHFRFKKISTQNIVNHLAHILHLENIEYQDEALEILARSGSGSLRDTLTLLDQAIIYSKSFVDVKTVTDMLGLIDPQFIDNIFSAIFAKDSAKLIEITKTLEDYEAEMVIDELIAYLKERLYNQDTLFSTLTLERFFRILSESKSLFAMNADGTFVLGLLFFKMVESLRIKEVDQMIEALESEVTRPSSISLPEPTPSVITPTVEVQTSTPIVPSEPLEPTPQEHVITQEDSSSAEIPSNVSKEVTQTIEETPIIAPQPEPEPASDANFELYETLLTHISDRSAELGRIFHEKIFYVSFENSTLTWESCVDNEEKKQLGHAYGVIKQLVREVFGFETEIKAKACSKTVEVPAPKVVTPPQEVTPTPSSMVEESEVGTGSCVTNCSESDLSTKEFDGHSILEEPMVKKAQELFEATKITVQSKI